MSRIINLKTLKPGDRVRLVDGSTAEVVSNPSDGIWVFGRYLSVPGEPAAVGTEERIFAQDIVGILEPS